MRPFLKVCFDKNKSSLHIFISIVAHFAKLQTLPKPCIAGRGNRGFPPVCLHPEQIKYVGVDHKASNAMLQVCDKRKKKHFFCYIMLRQTVCTALGYYLCFTFFCCCYFFSLLNFPTWSQSLLMSPAGKLTSRHWPYVFLYCPTIYTEVYFYQSINQSVSQWTTICQKSHLEASQSALHN